MKYMIFKDVVTVQAHGAVLLLQVGSTALCLGNSGRSNEGAILEIRLFAPMAEKRFTIKWRGLTKRAADECQHAWRAETNGEYFVLSHICDKCGTRR